jgi:succinoglycan biosynthesis protein ExoA
MIVSVLIPCYNEASFIEGCIKSVQSFELPVDVEIEILVLDGRSTDDTRTIVQELLKSDARIQLLDNPKRIQTCALNIGFREARGERILRLDAHAIYPVNYLKLCFETVTRTNADNVGGLFITQPRGDSYQAMLVQALTTHSFGVGNSGFRLGEPEGEADTVPYGFFKRDIINQIGWFDERLVRCQDYEFNRRLLESGGKIWRNPAIHVHYFNQPDLYSFYKKQIFLEAPYNPYMWYLAPYSFAYRHGITGIFALGVIGGLVASGSSIIFGATLAPPIASFLKIIGILFAIVMGLYFTLGVASAAQQALRYKYWQHLFTLPICFFLYHFIHGIGILWGVLMLALWQAPVQKNITEPWPGAGRKRAWPPLLTRP